MGAPTSFDGCRSARRGYATSVLPGETKRVLGTNAGESDRAWWGTAYLSAAPARELLEEDPEARVKLQILWDLDGAVTSYEVDLGRGVAIRFPGGRGQVNATVTGPVAWTVSCQAAIGTVPPVARPFVATRGTDQITVPVAPTCYEAICYSERVGDAFGTVQADLSALGAGADVLASVATACGFPPPTCLTMPGQIEWSASSRVRQSGLHLIQFLGA